MPNVSSSQLTFLVSFLANSARQYGIIMLHNKEQKLTRSLPLSFILLCFEHF